MFSQTLRVCENKLGNATIKTEDSVYSALAESFRSNKRGRRTVGSKPTGSPVKSNLIENASIITHLNPKLDCPKN